MRFGCCGNLVSQCPDGTGGEIVEQIAQLGFDYIELPLAEMSALPEEAFLALRDRVARSGIKCEVCNNFFPPSVRLTGPEADIRQAEEYVKRALDRAQALGVSVVVFGSGGAKTAPEGFPLEQAYEQVAHLSERIAPMAKARGIVIAIEPLRRQECNLINSFEEGAALARQVGHENLNVLVDYYHMSWEREAPEVLLRLGGEHLAHVHFACPNMGAENERSYPKDRSEWDYGPFVDALKGCGYDGRVSVEAYSKNFASDAAGALTFLKEVF